MHKRRRWSWRKPPKRKKRKSPSNRQRHRRRKPHRPLQLPHQSRHLRRHRSLRTRPLHHNIPRRHRRLIRRHLRRRHLRLIRRLRLRPLRRSRRVLCPQPRPTSNYSSTSNCSPVSRPRTESSRCLSRRLAGSNRHRCPRRRPNLRLRRPRQEAVAQVRRPIPDSHLIMPPLHLSVDRPPCRPEPPR
jgi:hypothetical protein